MSDPLSITASVAGVIALLGKTISLVDDYISSVKDAPTSVRSLLDEVVALCDNLRDFEGLLASDLDIFNQNNDSALRTYIRQCQTLMQSLCNDLRLIVGSAAGRLIWPWKERKHKRAMEHLRAFRESIGFALDLGTCKLLARTSTDVQSTLERQVELCKVFYDFGSIQQSISNTILQENRAIRQGQNVLLKQKMLDWISPDLEAKHRSSGETRTKETGQWITTHPRFVTWRDGRTPHRVLWCHGPQGSGKTILTCGMIDHVNGRAVASSSSVLFYYFDSSDGRPQGPYEILSYLLRQLLQQMGEIPENLADAYEKQIKLRRDEVQSSIEAIIHARDQNDVYLFLDGLDECEDATTRTWVMSFLLSLCTYPCVRLAVTCRPFYEDIRSAFHQYPQIEILAHRDDLRKYIEARLEGKWHSERLDKHLQNRIVNKIIEKSNGLFLLASQHVQSVLDESTVGDMEDALDDLCQNLSAAFQTTIDRIKRLRSRRQMELAMNALMWVCHSKRPLTVDELSEALSVRQDDNTPRPNYRPTEKAIVENCFGLIQVAKDSGSSTVQPAHASIRQFLLEHRKTLFPEGMQTVARICLSFLLFDKPRWNLLQSEQEITNRLDQHPFLAYASFFWGHHADDASNDEPTRAMAWELLNSKQVGPVIVQTRHCASGLRDIYWSVEECSSRSPLHVAARAGFLEGLRRLLDEGRYDINARSSIGTTPLLNAVDQRIAKVLLDYGADPTISNWYGDALQCAAEENQVEIVEILIREKHMDPNMYPSRPPLHCTLDCDSVESFEKLLDLGATIPQLRDDSIDDEDGFNGAAQQFFLEALFLRCSRVIEAMVQRGLVDPHERNGRGRTVLHYAAGSQNLAAIRSLMSIGADASAADKQGLIPREMARFL